MATLNVVFDFAASALSFTATPGSANSTMVFNSGAGNPAGSLSTSIAGKSHTDNDSWVRNMTYEAMGVPTGSTITAITSASIDAKCTAFTTGGVGNTINGNFLDTVFNAGSAIFLGGRSFSAVDGAFVTSNGTNQSGMSTPSATSIKLSFDATMVTGSSNTAVVTLLQDNMKFTITYTPPAVAYIPPRRPATTLVNRIVIF